MTNSRAKGKRGELEVSKLLKSHGFEARRGQQFSGGGDSPDVVHNIPNLHIEVKLTERNQIYDWIKQAQDDCQGKLPSVWHRKNRQDWLVTMTADDFIKIIKDIGELYERN